MVGRCAPRIFLDIHAFNCSMLIHDYTFFSVSCFMCCYKVFCCVASSIMYNSHYIFPVPKVHVHAYMYIHVHVQCPCSLIPYSAKFSRRLIFAVPDQSAKNAKIWRYTVVSLATLFFVCMYYSYSVCAYWNNTANLT